MVRVIVNIDVPELNPAITFYRSAFGLELTRIIDEDVAELSGASCVIYLLGNKAGSSPSDSSAQVRTYSRHWTPVHLDLVVEDIESAALKAEKAGAIQESECINWRGSKCISFADPFGHGFCLIEFEGETYDGDLIEK
jgi:predicted enzyme related to lactoylglutathione lyase